MTKYPPQDKQLIEFRSFLQKAPELLRKREADNSETDKEKLSKFKEWATKVQPIYNKRIESAKISIREYHTQNKRLLSPTTFEIMNRHCLEETHSNVIAYLLRKKAGKKLLKATLNILSQKVAVDLLKLGNNEYQVDREGDANKKRIDILITSKNYIIVIENKFNSKLHAIDDTQNQTEFYFSYINNQDQYKNKKKLFIILDYKNSESCDGYQRMDYSELLNALQAVHSFFRNDHIYEEYVFLLKRLLNNICGLSLENINGINFLSTLNNFKEVIQKWN